VSWFDRVHKVVMPLYALHTMKGGRLVIKGWRLQYVYSYSRRLCSHDYLQTAAALCTSHHTLYEWLRVLGFFPGRVKEVKQ